MPLRHPALFVLSMLTLAGCHGTDGPVDANTDAAPVDAIADDVPRADAGPVLVPCEETEPSDESALAPVASTLLGTVEPMASRVSMVDPNRNPVTEVGELSYRARNFHRYRRGAAQTRVTRAELGASAPPAGATRHSLLYFVQASDYQFVDDESPARFAGFETVATTAAIRPEEAYMPRAASAMNRTLRALARPERPFAFGVFAGDCTDSAHSNELRWFMQLMDGVPGLHTDSGADDDPLPGPNNDPKDPFDPVAFPAPWLYVPGNHDVEVSGIRKIDDSARATAVGNTAAVGTRDYTRRWGAVRKGRVVADPNRKLLDRADIVAALRAGPASPGPVGHGYPASPDLTHGAHYVYDLVPGLVRLIALDSTDETGGSIGLVRRATVDQFLRPALDAAARDGVLVFIASHHPSDSIDRLDGETGPAVVADAVPPREIEQLFAGYPNVVLWLVGHQHDVRVRAIAGADSAHPGYWEVQSGSIADWPGQSRVMELVDNGNGTLSIFGTMIDYEPTSCMERRHRRLQMMDFLSAWDSDHTGTPRDRNVELVINVPEAVRARAAYTTWVAGSPTRIESETTLRGTR